MVHLFLRSPFSQLEDVVRAGVEIQGSLFFMELTGDARRAGQQLFEEVLKDVTVFQRDKGTFQKKYRSLLARNVGNVKEYYKTGCKI